MAEGIIYLKGFEGVRIGKTVDPSESMGDITSLFNPRIIKDIRLRSYRIHFLLNSMDLFKGCIKLFSGRTIGPQCTIAKNCRTGNPCQNYSDCEKRKNNISFPHNMANSPDDFRLAGDRNRVLS